MTLDPSFLAHKKHTTKDLATSDPGVILGRGTWLDCCTQQPWCLRVGIRETASSDTDTRPPPGLVSVTVIIFDGTRGGPGCKYGQNSLYHELWGYQAPQEGAAGLEISSQHLG